MLQNLEGNETKGIYVLVVSLMYGLIKRCTINKRQGVCFCAYILSHNILFDHLFGHLSITDSGLISICMVQALDLIQS